MTVYSGKTNQDDNTNSKQDTGVEDWMTVTPAVKSVQLNLGDFSYAA